MDYRKIYNLLGRVIDEARLGQRECVKDIPTEHRICDHAWENLETLIEEIREVITAEDGAVVKSCSVNTLSEYVNATHRPFNHLS